MIQQKRWYLKVTGSYTANGNREQVEHESLIRQRMAEEEMIRERIDENGNRWTKVYFGGGAHLRN
jgi:coproporphyrinogen III oxidase-like Fe-S oxidoreductase